METEQEDGMVALSIATSMRDTRGCLDIGCTGRAILKGGSGIGRYRWECSTCKMKWTKSRDPRADPNVRISKVTKRGRYKCGMCHLIKTNGCACIRKKGNAHNSSSSAQPMYVPTQPEARLQPFVNEVETETGTGKKAEMDDEQRQKTLKRLKDDFTGGYIDLDTYRFMIARMY